MYGKKVMLFLGENQSTITNLKECTAFMLQIVPIQVVYALANQLNYDLKEPNELRVSSCNKLNQCVVP
jgi:hypothetical protein